jgi:hypothetical protein
MMYLSGSSPAGYISIRVIMTLLVMSDRLSLQSSRSMEMDMDMITIILSL